MLVKDYRSFIQKFQMWQQTPLEPGVYGFCQLDPYFEKLVLETLKAQLKGPIIFFDGPIEDQLGGIHFFGKPGAVVFSTSQANKDIPHRKWLYPVVIFAQEGEFSQKFLKENLKAPQFKPYETLNILRDLGRYRGFDLSYEFLEKIKHLDGSLCLWDSQFRYFRLAFGEKKIWSDSEEQEILNHLFSIFETQAMSLDRFLCEESYEKAHLLIHQRIVQGGDEPLRLLAFLARHIRTVLKIINLKKNGESLRKVGLPEFVIKGYQKVAISSKEPFYIKALIQCQKSDLLLKTTNIKGDLILSDVIFSLYT